MQFQQPQPQLQGLYSVDSSENLEIKFDSLMRDCEKRTSIPTGSVGDSHKNQYEHPEYFDHRQQIDERIENLKNFENWQ